MEFLDPTLSLTVVFSDTNPCFYEGLYLLQLIGPLCLLLLPPTDKRCLGKLLVGDPFIGK